MLARLTCVLILLAFVASCKKDEPCNPPVCDDEYYYLDSLSIDFFNGFAPISPGPYSKFSNGLDTIDYHSYNPNLNNTTTINECPSSCDTNTTYEINTEWIGQTLFEVNTYDYNSSLYINSGSGEDIVTVSRRYWYANSGYEPGYDTQDYSYADLLTMLEDSVILGGRTYDSVYVVPFTQNYFANKADTAYYSISLGLIEPLNNPGYYRIP